MEYGIFLNLSMLQEIKLKPCLILFSTLFYIKNAIMQCDINISLY